VVSVVLMFSGNLPHFALQGGVLSPYLFDVYIDTVFEKVRLSASGCHMKWHCVTILMYADDIRRLAPSVSSLQNLLTLCEIELLNIDMCLNVRKSVCTGIGSRYKQTCRNLVTNDGREIIWANTFRSLGVFVVSHSSCFCCSVDGRWA